MRDEWINVTPDEARRHRLFGVRGWLIFFALTHLTDLGYINNEATNHGYLLFDFLTLDVPEIQIIKSYLTVHLAATTVIFALLIFKMREFRKAAITILIIKFPVFLIVLWFADLFYVNENLVVVAISSLLHSAIWIVYLHRSRRVRVTFENTVKSDDPVLINSLRHPLASSPNYPNPEPNSTTEDKNNPSLSIAEEDSLYEKIAIELESGNLEKCLWTRAFAQSSGDEQKTKAEYIKLRMERLVRNKNGQI